SSKRFEIADIERIRHPLIQIGGDGVVASIGSVPELSGQRVEPQILTRKQPVAVLAPVCGFDEDVRAELPLNADSPALHARMYAIVTTEGEALTDSGHRSERLPQRNVEASSVGPDREWVDQRRDSVLRVAHEPGGAAVVGDLRDRCARETVLIDGR